MYMLWQMILMFGGILAEVFLGNCGLSLPVTLLCGCYFAVVVPWRQAFFPLLLTALMMEAFRLHVFPVYLFSMVLLLFLGNLAKRAGDTGSWSAGPLAGLAVAVVWLLCLGIDFLCQGFSFSWTGLGYCLKQLFVLPVLFPLLQLSFDFMAELLRFRRWSEASRYSLQNLDKETTE